MLLHNGLDFLRKLRRGRGARRLGRDAAAHEPALPDRPRAGVVLSFPVLVVTGFALKYPDAWWAAPLVAFEGSVALAGLRPPRRRAGAVRGLRPTTWSTW